MELHQLRIFESVSRHLNITHAAAELCMSQPAVSLQLKQLEKHCKSRFYVRKNDGVSLTLQGYALLDAVEPILAQLDRIELEFKGKESIRETRPFSVGSSRSLSATVLPELLLEFKRRNPKVHLVVETSDSRAMEERVQRRQVDLALVTTSSKLPGFACEPYLEHEAVAFVTPNQPLRCKTLSLWELAQMPLVVHRANSAIQELQSRGYELKFAAEFDTVEAVKTAVRGGMGVGILFRSHLESELTRRDLWIIDVPELKSIVLKSFVIYAKRSYLPPNVQSFLQILREQGASAAAGRRAST
jgi:DNA-binding transcriptional LysR family regulator